MDRYFLIDTCAQISVIPSEPKQEHTLSTYTLWAANGSKIKTYEERALTFNLGLRWPFSHNHKWKMPILEADFFITFPPISEYGYKNRQWHKVNSKENHLNLHVNRN